MFKEIFSFEVRYQFKQPIVYIAAGIFFILTFFAISSDAVTIGGAIGNVNRNAPFVILQLLGMMSVLGVFATVAFVATAINRDYELGTSSLFFSTPMKKRDYLFGRFFGSLVAAFAVYVVVALGIFIGSLMPWLEAERVGPFLFAPYAWAMLVMVLPNLLLTGAIFFSLAAMTRSLMYTYVGCVAFFVLYAIAQTLLSNVERETLASLADPFGLGAFSIATKYWTVFERNAMVPNLLGPMLWNRLIWLGVAAAILGFTYRRFKFAAVENGGRRAKKHDEEPEETIVAPVSIAQPGALAAERDFSSGSQVRQFLHQTKLEFDGIVRSPAFIILVLFGILNIVGNAVGSAQFFGTNLWPVTSVMISVIQSCFILYAFIIIVFYSGELIWRERQLNLSEVYDALPVPNWALWASKMTALAGAILVLQLVAALTAIVFQLAKGYPSVEIPLYLKSLFVDVAWGYLLTAAFSFFLQIMGNNKYLGFLLMTLLFISFVALPALDFEHVLYRYGQTPPNPYSDMNGYGHWVAPVFWLDAYWTFFAIALLAIGHLFWVRGTETSLRWRSVLARRRIDGRVTAVLAVSLLAFVASGAWVFYNTNILNKYRTTKQRESQQAEFEKKYKRFERLAQPRIVDAKADVDIFPETRGADIRGRYVLRNKTAQPIAELHISINPLVKINSITVPGASPKMQDRENGYYIYSLTPPMQPGEDRPLDYDIAVRNEGFTNNLGNTDFVHNGTFFNNFAYFPNIGYQPGNELVDTNKRKKNGLPPIQRMPKMGDRWASNQTYLTGESDWLNFETTVSTSADQIAIAPGYLQREWTQNGRHYFHYKMDSPILGFWSYLSARYTVKKDKWHDVPIEIYYHEPHKFNVDRMIDGVKKSLDYYTANFGPYQHRQVRIIEFPRYQTFAQSFPNTIPYSEGIGFIARLEDPEDIDYVFYVTAHEMAHQWWAHQVIGANMQGATVLSETLSQYSALMVMEKEYGRDTMQRFLKYELDRYLQGRGGELIEEEPLSLVENQGYIHYRKGSLVMYALRDYMGEAALNGALKRFVADHKFKDGPYPTSLDLLRYIREAAAPELQPVIGDMFEKITLYENRATAATWKKRADGKYVVTIDVEAGKFYATGKGKEEKTRIDDLVDIGVLGEKPKKGAAPVLFMEKRRIDQPKMKFEIVVGSKPARAGIDPLNKLIDRNPDDNTVTVEAGT